MLQAVDKEAQSLQLAFSQISLLALGFLPLSLSNYLFAGKDITQ